MYSVRAKETEFTLRPEGTAGTIRAMLQNGLLNEALPQRVFYILSCFRHERPQAGRLREFHQFGVEMAGSASPAADAEVISLAKTVLERLGLKNIELHINSIGCPTCLAKYHEALRTYFSARESELCDTCKERLVKNPMRLLDCKSPICKEIGKDAPVITDYLCEDCSDHFAKLQKYLTGFGIEYTVDPRIVRGLDYYSGVVFEFHYTSSKGKNYGAIGAGGHYGKLVSEIGGPEVEGCGYAMGIERLASVMSDDNLFEDLTDTTDIYVMPLGERATAASLGIANYLRVSGYNCEVCLEGKAMSQMFKKAERRNALYAIIVGDNELDNDEFVIKNLASQEQFKVSSDDLLKKLDELLNFEGRKHFECCDGDCDCEGDCDCDESEENKGCCCRHKE
jgi:histidyl-tRNA synthetase